jgi:hypothetical protein
MELADTGVRMNLFLVKARAQIESIHAVFCRRHAEPTNLIRLGLYLKHMCFEFLIVLYPSLLFEEGTVFISEIVKSVVQGDFATLLA